MISLYDLTVVSYARVLDATIGFLKKSEAHFKANDQDLNDIVSMQLAPDMFAFPFQINSVQHHSLHAAQAILSGEFGPPEPLPELDFNGLVEVLEKARKDLDSITADEINARSGKPVIFKMGSMEIPFTAENFALAFSIPNLYFHAATTYDILRIKGAPIGKMDFMGKMPVGV